ncbi:MAG: type IV pilus secretin PilQ [Gammaproteobacteria bacterium]|nr:type IV pilus secretin PilQ [Gammaproteobacteria bacterium]
MALATGRAGLSSLALLAVLTLGLGSAAAAAERQLESIDVQTLPGNRLELRLTMSSAAPEPLAFTIDSPARIALDLPDTALRLDSRRRDVNVGPLSTILAAEADGRTRVVLNLDSMVPYQTQVSGNTILVTLGSDTGRVAATSFPAAAAESRPTPTRTDRRSVQDVDFRRGADGAGRIQVRLSDPNTTVDVREEGGRVVVSFRDTELPTELMRRLDVVDFATPVTTVDAMRVDRDTRMIIAASGDWEHMAYQSDTLFTVEVKAAAPAPEVRSPFDEERTYSGERLTLNFQDIETRAVLQLLADVSGLNMVVADTVTGNVTLRLQNVPWDQALDIVMATKGLDKRRNGDVVLIAPAAEIAARERAELSARQEIQQLEPLRSEFLQVNYAKAADLGRLISGEGRTRSFLSERGSVAIDERTNTLLLNDTTARLADIRRLVATLDIPVRQVLIESRIVIVSDDFNRELGVRLGLTQVGERGGSGLISMTGTGAGSASIVDSALDNLQNTGQPFPVQVGTIDQRYNVNLPVANPAGSIALAFLGADTLIDLELSALQAEGRAEVVSTPRVIVSNQREARIEQGVEIPYQESSASGATATQFKKAVLSLTVTPQITPDNRIIMDLMVSKDNVGEILPSATGGFVPSIDTRQITTQVLVNDGETVVLGGIFETERRDFTSKVPLLGDIPVLGHLFRSNQRVSNKAELLIFVTPKILREGATIN